MLPAHWDESFTLRTGVECTPAVFEGASLQNIRAIPASSGSLLAWNQTVFHWGGRASKLAQNPRCNVSVEFQRGDKPLLSRPLIDPEVLPPFQLRLGLIGHLIRQYAPFHKFHAPEILCLAAALQWKYRRKS